MGQLRMSRAEPRAWIERVGASEARRYRQGERVGMPDAVVASIAWSASVTADGGRREAAPSWSLESKLALQLHDAHNRELPGLSHGSRHGRHIATDRRCTQRT